MNIFQWNTLQDILAVVWRTQMCAWMKKKAKCPFYELWAEENICIVLAYFPTNSHPSFRALFVLPQTFCAWAQYSRSTSLSSGRASLTTVLPLDYCPYELCVDIKGVEAEPGDVGPLSHRGEERDAVQCVWYSTCTIRPFTGDRNLSPVPWQCLWQPKAVSVVSPWELKPVYGSCSSYCLIFERSDVYGRKKKTHLSPLTQTDMFLQLQPHDTRPGS